MRFSIYSVAKIVCEVLSEHSSVEIYWSKYYKISCSCSAKHVISIFKKGKKERKGERKKKKKVPKSCSEEIVALQEQNILD